MASPTGGRAAQAGEQIVESPVRNSVSRLLFGEFACLFDQFQQGSDPGRRGLLEALTEFFIGQMSPGNRIPLQNRAAQHELTARAAWLGFPFPFCNN